VHQSQFETSGPFWSFLEKKHIAKVRLNNDYSKKHNKQKVRWIPPDFLLIKK